MRIIAQFRREPYVPPLLQHKPLHKQRRELVEAKIKSVTEQLEQASHAMSKAMYESAQTQAPSPETEPAAKNDDDAIDAEFEVKK